MSGTSKTISSSFRGLAMGTILFVGVAALPQIAGARLSDVPQNLQAEHKNLPRTIRYRVEVTYQKIRYLNNYIKRADEKRAKESLAEAEQWWSNAMKAAGDNAFTDYPVMKKHYQALVTARKALKGGIAKALKTGCPKDKYRNRRLKRAIRKALLNTFDRK